MSITSPTTRPLPVTEVKPFNACLGTPGALPRDRVKNMEPPTTESPNGQPKSAIHACIDAVDRATAAQTTATRTTVNRTTANPVADARATAAQMVAEAVASQAQDVFDSPISPAEVKDLALSAAQTLAIELMLSGNTMVAAATAAGVTRRTIYRWLHHDAKFQAAYNAWQLDAVTSARSKVLAAADDAACAVATAVKTDGRLAFEVLRSLGICDRPAPGSTDPEEIQEQMDIEEQKAHAARGEELFFASIGTGAVNRDGKPSTASLLAQMRKMREKK